MGDLFKDTEEEVRLILPEKKIFDALGRDPDIKIYHGKDIKSAAGVQYNTVLSVTAHLQGKYELLQQFFMFSDRPDYDDMLKIKGPPQVLMRDTLSDGDAFVQLHLAAILEGDLYINDICLTHPSKEFDKPPLPHQENPGLGNGIFDVILENITKYAKKQGMDLISCQVVSPMHKDIFEKRGFELDTRDPILYEMALQTGLQIPMCKKVE